MHPQNASQLYYSGTLDIYYNEGAAPDIQNFSYATNTVDLMRFGNHVGFDETADTLAVKVYPPAPIGTAEDSSPVNDALYASISIVRADYVPLQLITRLVDVDGSVPALVIEGVALENHGGGPFRVTGPRLIDQTVTIGVQFYFSDTSAIGPGSTTISSGQTNNAAIHVGERGHYFIPSGVQPTFSPSTAPDWLIVQVDPGNNIRESNEGNNIRAYRIHKQPPLVLTNHPNVEAVAGGGAAIGIPISNVLEQQWFFNGSPLVGETNSTLTLTNVQPAQAGSYTLVASNFLGSVTSAPVALSIALPPQITVPPPANVTNLAGSTALFSVTATGTAPLAYQWRFNGSPLLSAINSTLSLTNIQPAQAGNYTVVITNVAGSVTSSIAALTVQLVPPSITTPPAGQSFTLGQNLALTATVSGTGPFTYQWTLNGTNLVGATNATLSLTNLTVVGAGAYRVVVSNAAGTATSDPARLNFVGLNLFPVLTIADVVGSSYRIEATSDLVNSNSWTTLTNLALPSSPYLFIDTSTPQAVRRYYRAIALP